MSSMKKNVLAVALVAGLGLAGLDSDLSSGTGVDTLAGASRGAPLPPSANTSSILNGWSNSSLKSKESSPPPSGPVGPREERIPMGATTASMRSDSRSNLGNNKPWFWRR